MAEVGHHLLDRFFQAVEIAEGRVDLDDLVAEDAREALIVPGVQQFRLADGHEHALGRGGVGEWIVLASLEVLLNRELVFTRLLVA